MSRNLRENISSDYFHAANQLSQHRNRRRIVAYVESYDDIFFWRSILSQYENDHIFFEVMLPSRINLNKGKKSVLMNYLGEKVGEDMIACVDADYDYLMQGATPTSEKILESPYVFHTYVYAIENYQCYAPSLHDVCVMVTLNDHAVFDFKRFFDQFSSICYPLFVWSIWFYRCGHYGEFTLTDLCKVCELGGFNIHHPEVSLQNLERKVGRNLKIFSQRYASRLDEITTLDKELKELGVTPDTTYLYIQGHHIFDNIVSPIMGQVCEKLRRERENEIYHNAEHRTQMHNELSSYEHSLQDITSMLKRNTNFKTSEPFLRLKADLERFLNNIDKESIPAI